MTENTIWKLERLLEDTKVNHFSLSEKRAIIKEVSKGIKKPLLPLRKIGEYYDRYVCPNCQETAYITNSTYHPKRCSVCGQKLDWKEFIKAEENNCKKFAERLMCKE